jgi:hypothetical protein
MAEDDPRQVLRAAREFAARGEYADALREYLWFHHNALAHDQALYGVRLSYAIYEWADLGEVFPPARTAMESLRDEKVKALRAEPLDFARFHDVTAINAALGHQDQTAALFAEFAKGDREFAGRCFSLALPALIHTRNFSLARSFLLCPKKLLEDQVEILTRCMGYEEFAESRDAFINIYVRSVEGLLSVLRGVGEIEEASQIAMSAVESIVDPEIRAVVSTRLGWVRA